MRIFIEHTVKEAEFAERLAKRLRTIKGVDITTYNDLVKIQPEMTDEELVEEFFDYDIIIPVVADDYDTNEVVNDKLDEFSNSKNKFILPIIYDDSQWSSISWIVKSKVFPESGEPYNILNEKAKLSTFNKLISTIENIVAQVTNPIPEENSILKSNIVFISHSHDDADFAELLKLNMEKNGINGWIDGDKLKIGQDWRQEIDDSIDKSIALIVIMTPEAKNSEYVTYEWAFGWGKQIPIFPIMLKQTTLHPRLESLQYLDFTNRLTRPWQKLIDSIKALQK